MVTVHDVAAFILKDRLPMNAVKLQKLVYYSQAWSLVWDEKPLFPEHIEAWVNGPVVPALFKEYRGLFEVTEIKKGDPKKLSPEQVETIEVVLQFYGDKSAQWLSQLTHMEDPWRNAREGLAPTERGDSKIGLDSMQEYYGALAANADP
jgi:uncharacterized phage-associated protein